MVKMTLEATQILHTALWLRGVAMTHYRPTHRGHPAVRWASEGKLNFIWLWRHAMALSREYTYRYGRVHSCQPVIERMRYGAVFIRENRLTPFVQCMPDQYKGPDAVLAYRTYYLNDKAYFARWSVRSPPEWWKGG